MNKSAREDADTTSSGAETPAETGDSNSGGPQFPIVGVGASAGGLAAFEAFFSGMPVDRDMDMAFVLVQHLDPNHHSILSELVRRYTTMTVLDVEDGMRVESNCAYIIPPNRDMTITDGTLYLTEPLARRGQRLPIDSFLRSLAADQRERSIGVILSGTGADGTQGVRAIKGEGGMVMVQEPDSTEFDGMPRSAIATTLVDFILLPTDMATQLSAYASHAFGPNADVSGENAPFARRALGSIFVHLRARTGHDFSQYKVKTIQRRIARRISVCQVNTIDAYERFLRENPTEVETLARELMIGVTSFFRDPESFSVLGDAIAAEIVASKSTGDTIRVWCAGCSTGEEAYSIAILFRELLDEARKECTVHVFATDIDTRAISEARAGTFPVGIAADLSPDRLARFFVRGEDGTTYRVRKPIRDMLVFSEQDIVRDPPFSKLDLISCRNLLIYMQSALQRRIFPIFHYALQTGGLLFLGTSETIGDFGDLFAVRDRSAKLFARKEGVHVGFRSAASSSAEPKATAGRAASPLKFEPVSHESQLREATEKSVLELLAPAAVLVTPDGSIQYVYGRTGLYLEHPPGVAGASNVLKMAREGLRHDLIVALHRARSTVAPVVSLALRVTSNEVTTTVDVTISPVALPAGSLETDPMFVVLFSPRQSTPVTVNLSADPSDDEAERDRSLALLEQQLHEKDEYLRTTVEELETSNEELRSSNEELQSVNEELQSTNEELETSKEELQSINEELSTVNAELQANVGELSRLNNDMNNLLSGTGIGTIFVDNKMCILRFTPTVTKIINLIPGDIGRPVGHVVSNLTEYDGLVQDVESVLNTLAPREAEVQTVDGDWYVMRVVPYRTTENVIEGAVITFFNINETVQARERIDVLLRQKELLLREVHHRVKNNMNTIADLLSLQADKLESGPAEDALTDSQSRVRAMAVLYEKFYTAEVLESVSLKTYLEPLISESVRDLAPRMKIDLKVDIEDATLAPAQLFPLGILVNELLSNVVKYAFPDRKKGALTVLASRANGKLVISVADDGVGIPESIDVLNTTGFGLTLVGLLTQQLGGEIRVERDHGTKFVLEITE